MLWPSGCTRLLPEEIGKEEKMNTRKKVSLCPACGACPEVVLYESEAWIGEEGNLAKLNKEAWNQLVEEIQKGNLKKIGA